MEDRKEKLENFKKLFNDIPTGNEENDNNSSFSQKTFDESIVEVKDRLKDCDKGHVIEDIHEGVEEICSDNKNIKNKEDIKEDEISFNSSMDDFDSIPELENKKEIKEEIKEETKEEISSLPEKKSESKLINTEKGSIQTKDGKIEWFLKSSSSLYDNFYERKKELVEVPSCREQLDFNRFNNEMINASVNVTSETFDQELIQRQMEEVQQHRNRMKNIHIKCTVQYFIWKSWMKMLRGYLARIEYLKPAIKQDGLVMEHMRDFEHYFSQLEALYDNCQEVENNLEAAYVMLSRKVSICMELKPTARYSKQSYDDSYQSKKEKKEEQKEMEDFDELQMGQSTSKKTKTGIVGWGDIG